MPQAIPDSMTPTERRAAAGLAGIFALRMLGLFLILPVFALHAPELAGATPLLIGLAIGAYGLTQALFQIPFGMLSDRIGRKPVIFGGLLLFALGSVVAALADSIGGVILGRVLQGGGAIAAAVMALTADLTRESVRTRAMAGIGMSIGLAFALALVLGPLLAHAFGLSGIFWFTALLALGGLLILVLVVPSPAHSSVHRDAEPVAGQFRAILTRGELLRLDFGVLTLHLLMTSLFLAVPLALEDRGLPAAHHWWIYLPVLGLSIAAMIPFILQAESRGRLKPVFLGAIAALGLAALGLREWGGHLVALAIWLWVFFTAFNLLEAMLPSLIAKVAPAEAKGTAMGVFSTAQFPGAFLGGLLGGWMHQHGGTDGVLWLCALAVLPWLAIALPMANPRPVSHRILPLSATARREGLRDRLLAVPGVEEAVVVEEEALAYLKIDRHRLDWTRVEAIAAGD